MPYRIQASDTDATALLRRIAAEELDLAARTARDAQGASRIHDLRKATKKTRGLLRLFSQNFAGFEHENAALRDAAAVIGHLRDAEVLHDTLAQLTIEAKGSQAEAVAELDAALRPRHGELPVQPALAEFADRIEDIAVRASRWHVAGKGWRACAPGLMLSYDQARKRMKSARSDLDDHAIHRWRSRVKHHWYHTRLLAPIWPEAMQLHADFADRLGEVLGQHHDLAVLIETAPRHLDGVTTDAITALARGVQKRQEAEAFHLGSRLFAEPPEALADRWGRWFKLWRAE